MMLPLDSADVSLVPVSFSMLLHRAHMCIELDPVIRTFAMLFIVQAAMLIGFVLYCDCPWVVYLDIKLQLFYLAVCHLAMSTVFMHQLLCFELIGLFSFRLIGHYMDRLNAQRGSHIAVGVNRIADVILALLFIKCTVSVPCQ